MLTRRIKVNLAVFALLGLMASAYAVTNVLSMDAITHPYFVKAEFSTSPGLRQNFEVAYLGVQVGSISAVRLLPGRATVTLKINHGTKLPRRLRAAAARQSVVGEPYIELSPPQGYTGGGPYVGNGYVIPLTATTTPFSYQQVFDAIGRLINAVPPADLNSLLHELATGVGGRSDQIRQLVENTAALTQTFATNSPEISQAIDAATQLSRTLAEHGGAVASSLDNLAALSAALAASKQNVDALLDQTPGMLQQVNSLLDASAGSLGCVVEGLGTVAGILGTPSHVADLARVLELSPTLLKDLQRMDVKGPDGPYLRGTSTFNVFGPSPPVPAEVQALPTPPRVPTCGSAGPPPAPAGPSAAGAGNAVGSPGSSGIPRIVPAAPADRPPPSTTKPVASRALPLLALIIVALLILGLAVMKPWRLLPASRGRRRPGR